MRKRVIYSLLTVFYSAVAISGDTVPDDLCKFIKGWNRPSVGLFIRDYNHPSETIRINGVTSGAVVVNMLIGSPADIQNLPVGVVITMADGRPVENADRFQEIMREDNKEKITIEYAGKITKGKKTLRLERASDKIDPCRVGEKRYNNDRYPNPPKFNSVANRKSAPGGDGPPDVCLDMQSVNEKVVNVSELCKYLGEDCRAVEKRILEGRNNRFTFLNGRKAKDEPVDGSIDVTLYCERGVKQCDSEKLWLEDGSMLERIVNRKLTSTSRRQSIQVKDGVTKKEHEICGTY